MSITSIQKVIKIGSSAGVTLPARDLKAACISLGDQVEITVTKIQHKNYTDEASPEVVKILNEFMKKYDKALKNLADR